MKRIVSVSILFMFFTAAVFCWPKKKEPAWVTDVNSVYPSSKYIAELGEGKTKTAAEIDGVAHISRYFESNVDTTTLGHLYMNNQDKEVSQKSDIQTETIVTSNVNLFAIKYSESYKDKKSKKIYVVSYIDRDEAYTIFRPKVDVPAKQFSSLYSDAEKCLRQGDFLEAVKFLKNARRFAPAFEEQYCFALLLNRNKVVEFKEIHNQICEIDALILKSLQNCQLEISVENDLDNQIEAKAKNIFSAYGFPVGSKNGLYKVVIDVNLDERTLQKGTACYPHVNVSVLHNEVSVLSFGFDCEKVSAVNADVAVKRAYSEVADLLESAVIKQFELE